MTKNLLLAANRGGYKPKFGVTAVFKCTRGSGRCSRLEPPRALGSILSFHSFLAHTVEVEHHKLAMASSNPKAEARCSVIDEDDEDDAKSMAELSDSPGHDALTSRFKAIQDSIWLSQDSVKTQERARSGMTTEMRMTFLDCLRRYPKAVGWSLLLISTVIMEAYDKLLITGLFALPAFGRQYGEPSSTPAAAEISPGWQMALQNASIIAEIVGLLAFGLVTGVTGYRPIMWACLAWICVAVFPAVFADNLATLLISQVLLGRCPLYLEARVLLT